MSNLDTTTTTRAPRKAKAPRPDYNRKAYGRGTDGRRYVRILPAGPVALEATDYVPNPERPGTPVSATYRVVSRETGKAYRTVLVFHHGAFHVGATRAKSMGEAIRMVTAPKAKATRTRAPRSAPAPEATPEATPEA